MFSDSAVTKDQPWRPLLRLGPGPPVPPRTGPKPPSAPLTPPPIIIMIRLAVAAAAMAAAVYRNLRQCYRYGERIATKTERVRHAHSHVGPIFLLSFLPRESETLTTLTSGIARSGIRVTFRITISLVMITRDPRNPCGRSRPRNFSVPTSILSLRPSARISGESDECVLLCCVVLRREIL
jgi:hypothetical protein